MFSERWIATKKRVWRTDCSKFSIVHYNASTSEALGTFLDQGKELLSSTGSCAGPFTGTEWTGELAVKPERPPSGQYTLQGNTRRSNGKQKVEKRWTSPVFPRHHHLSVCQRSGSQEGHEMSSERWGSSTKQWGWPFSALGQRYLEFLRAQSDGFMNDIIQF